MQPSRAAAASTAEEGAACFAVGAVAGEDGAPLPGARVAVVWEEDPLSPAATDPVTCDAAGRFRLDLGKGFGSFHVEATADGRERGRTLALPARPGQTIDVGTLVLAPGSRVAGKVIDERGAPVPGAVVAAGALETTADADGRFELTGLAAGYVAVRAHAGERVLAYPGVVSLYLEPGMALEELTLQLQPDAAISGRVVDERGRPVAGATVEARPSVEGQFWLRSAEQSDASGAFRIGGLDPAATYRLRAWAPGHTMVHPPEAAAGASDLEIVLPKPRTITVRVVDAGDGSPVRDAVVHFTVPATDRDPTGFEVEPGIYELTRPAPLTCTIEASAAGYAANTASLVIADDAAVLPEVLIHLQPVPALEGRVVRADGTPVSGARVEVGRALYPGQGYPRVVLGVRVRVGFAAELETRSDESGRFRLGWSGDLAGAEDVQVRVSAPSLPPRIHALVPGARESLVIQLPHGGAIEGIVADAPGPVPVVAHRFDGVHQVGFAAADGRFRLADLAPGRYRVEAGDPRILDDVLWDAGDVADGGDDYPIVVADGGVVQCSIAAAGTGTTLTGRVTVGRETGRGLSVTASWLDAQAAAPRPAGAPPWTFARTDHAGEFALRNLQPGPYEVWVSSADLETVLDRREVTLDRTGEVHLDLHVPAGALQGRLVDANSGRPLPGVTVHVFPDDPLPRALERRRRTDPDGRFHFERLRAGTWNVDVRVPAGFALLRRQVDIADGATARLELAAVPQASIRVACSSGEWPATARVEVTGLEGQVVPWSPHAPKDGALVISHLSEGGYRVRVHVAGRDLLVREVELVRGGAAEITFDPDAAR